jgi:calcium-dependent protein kinase
MAPEVFQREYGLEADMWSLGMMLYQCMTCRFPFWPSIETCRQKSLDEVARAVILDEITLNFGPWLSMSPEVCIVTFVCLRSPLPDFGPFSKL